MTKLPRQLAVFTATFIIILLVTAFDQAAIASPLEEASGGLESYCPADGTLFARIVICLENTVIDATVYFMEQFYPAVRETVTWVLTLAVILYGSMMAIGAIERVARDSMTFLFKFGGVVYFMQEAINIYLQFVNMLMGTVTEISNLATFGTGLRCPAAANTGATTEPMWERADCIFDVMIGLSGNAAMVASSPYEGLQRGTMGFFFYNLQSGALGILIGIVGIYICFNLLMAMLRAVYSYLVSLIVLSFLFIIGALFMPLIIFNNTYQYFNAWLKNVLGVIIQPLILFAYLNILITAFDIMLYSGDNSLMRTIAGDAVDDPNFNIHEYAEANNLYTENYQAFVHDTDPTKLNLQQPTENEGLLGNNEFTEQVPDYTDFAQIPIDMKYRVVDYTQIPGGAAALAGATLMVGLASYILVMFMKDLPKIAEELAGGVRNTASVLVGGSNNMEMPFTRETTQITSGFNNVVSNNFNKLVGVRG